MNTEALAIVEDPESFSEYIYRQSEKRKKIENDIINSKNIPGSGYLWKRRTMLRHSL